MNVLKEFRKANGLTQEQLGEFIGMKKSFISKIENGQDPLPEARRQQILNNPYGWDIEMFSREEETPAEKPLTPREMLLEITRLQRQIEKLEAEKAEYWDLIKKLTDR